MIDMPSSTDRIGEHLARAIRILGQVSGDVRTAGHMLAILGWDLPPGVEDIGLAGLDVARVRDRIDNLTETRSREDASDLETAAAIAEVLGALAEAFEGIEEISRSLQAAPDYLSATEIGDQFFPRLADLLFIQAVGSAAPAAVPLGILLGVFEFKPMPADPAIFQVEHIRQAVRWDRFSLLFTDPTGVLHDVYGWGTTDFNGNVLVTNIGRLLDYFSADIALERLRRQVEEQIAGHPIPEADAEPGVQLHISIGKGLGFDAFDVGVILFPLRESNPGDADGGIGLSPFASGTSETEFPLSDTLSLVLSSLADLQGGLTLILRAGGTPELLPGLFELPDEVTPPTSFGLALRSASSSGERSALFSAPVISAEAAAVTLGFSITVGNGLNPTLSAGIEDGRIRLASDSSDGFLAAILPQDGITTTLDLKASWSQREGLRIQGGAGLSTSIVLRQQLGPLLLDTLDLAITARSDALIATVTITGAAIIGPITARVESIGAAAALRFQRGNIGNADLSVQFKPPNGVGLSIDATAVTGGGFLEFDPEKGQYSGVVQLNLEGGIAVKGIGMIATRLPGGSKGYSLLIIITAEGFQPIPLPMGFRLTGIGGLLAVNRTFSEDVLRAGLKNHALDSILFPQDPIRNAPQILSSLNQVYPPADGHYLFGPMMQIEWGTPTMVTAEVALVLEFGARLRLLVLAQIASILPNPENDLIRLQMDAVGVVDFDQGTAALDATLHDSRLLQKFVLTGDMALRLKWTAPPNFTLAVGGLHPAYNPPPNFPKLERIAINLASGDNPRIRCEAYYALTGSSIQFGARAELYASAAGFSIQGEIGYDVLIQRDPFAFQADFEAKVQLKRGSTNLLMVKVEGALAGPRPLHIKAKATFEVLWWDASIRIDRTLVEGEMPPLPSPVDVLPLLLDALRQPGSWTAHLPAGQRPMVTLRGRPETAGVVLLHPLGQLTVSQSIVPLDMDISRFGDAMPAAARRFTISTVSLGGMTQAPALEFFAPAQFFEMSDADKLSQPSFESMKAGVSLGSTEFDFSASPTDWIEVQAIQFETIIAGQQQDGGGPTPLEDLYKLNTVRLGQQSSFGAAANSALRHTGTAKYRTTADKHRVAKEGWSIVATDDLTVQPAPDAQPASYSEAQQALRRLRRQDPAKAAGLKILRLSEVQGSG
jgi:hypothetical protein